MKIKVPVFVVVITTLTGLIATALGLWASLSPQTHPQFIEGATKIVLSWSGRELGQGLAALATVAFIRDARGYAIAIGSSWVREVIDFVDFFRIADTPTRLYFVVGTSVILHSIALWMTIKAIRERSSETSV